ncbi:DUF2398 family protein [Kitasatospora viridis]|uniref:Uncharacterized protein DUF2397 n=1 Tax=Kitasatospora viridis TaxID=281105 RepID=A0A561UAU8_9ACTN|nr:DUF2398 family protein [Kitasatospora viridis]TWF96475.1 uncharacterized protein DUF2397 [Kitasatospora viridis]
MNGGGALHDIDPPGATMTLRRRTTPTAPAPRPPRGRAPEAAQLLLLARRFADCAPDAAHDLFADAFGLYGARHFGTAPDPAAADLAAVSWWHGPTVRQPAPRPRRGRRTAAAPAGPVRGGAGRHRKREASAQPATEQQATERRAAARLLLARPLVTADGPQAAALTLIHRHAQWLTERFAELLGYRLIVGAGFARLVKAELGPGADRPLLLDGTAGTPARYAALAVTLCAVLLGPDRWAPDQLAARSAELCAEGAIPVDGPELAAAVRQLTEWRVLVELPERWCGVDQELAAALAAACRPAQPEDPPVPRTTIPVAVRRRLAETPVLLVQELTALEREWLWESREREAELFADFLGLVAEIRAEGVALLDPAGELTDLRLPGPGPLAEAALVLVERLVEELRPAPEPAAPVGVPIAEALIDGILGDVADEWHPEEQGPELGEEAERRRAHLADRAAFRREVLGLLHRAGLIAPAPASAGGRGGWLLLAPAARYAEEFCGLPAGGTGRHSRR